MALADVLAALTEPFDLAEIQVRPGAVSHDGTRALALAYADWRAYAERLDIVVGPAHWSIRLRPWGEHRIIAELRIFDVVKAATGEGDPSDPNCGTTAEAQAKKRACAEFGLGRYLYALPKCWGSGSGDRRSFRFADGEERRLMQHMYQHAGLLPSQSRSNGAQRAPEPPPSADSPGDHQGNGNGTSPVRLARARAALKEAQDRTAQPAPAHPATKREEAASDRQLGKIAGMLRSLTPAGLQPVQTKFGLDLAGVSSRDDLRTLGLSKRQASALIDALNVAELVP